MSRWLIEKSGTGIEKSGTGIEKSGTGIEKSGTGIEKFGTGIEKSGTGIRQGLLVLALTAITFATLCNNELINTSLPSISLSGLLAKLRNVFVIQGVSFSSWLTSFSLMMDSQETRVSNTCLWNPASSLLSVCWG